MDRQRKRNMFICIAVVLALLAFRIATENSTVQMDLTDHLFTISWENYESIMDLNQVVSMELLSLSEPGICLDGFEDETLACGVWENDVWGAYHLYSHKNMNASPSLAHICGTDALGRDVFTRLLYGGRQSLLLGFMSSFLGVFMAIIVGCVAGYFGGKVETIIMRLMDIMSAIPGMLLSMLISTAFGNGLFNTILALSIGTIPSGVRMIRAQILKERSQEYLEAAESVNCSKVSIMFQHLLPNVISPMIVTFTMGIGSQISAASSLSVLGMGVLPPAPEWGAMLSEGRLHFLAYPHQLLFPGLCIAMTIFAVNLFGDSLRDAIDPKLKK